MASDVQPLAIDRQIVAPKTSKPPPNPLLERHVYKTVGDNGVFRAKPGVMHFAGFALGETAQQTLHIMNVSAEPRNLHVVPPQTSHFRLEFTKPSAVAPGLALSVRVLFTPDAHRYYYDCIRLHCEGANLLVPLHAYPVVGSVALPPRIDFGAVPLGEARERVVQLSSDVPLDFCFEVRLLASHPSVHIAPLSGVLPGGGSVALRIGFQPDAHATVSASFELVVAQTNFVPLRCEVAGSCGPGLVREALMRVAERRAAEREDVLRNEVAQAGRGELAIDLAPVSSLGPSRGLVRRGGGAGHGDAVARRAQPARARAPDAAAVLKATAPAPAAELGASSAVALPASLAGHAAVAFVLNQKAGLMRKAALRTAIAEKRRVLESGGAQSSRGVLHDPAEGAQSKAIVLAQCIQAQREAARAAELRWFVALGAAEPSAADRDAVLAMRAAAAAARQAAAAADDEARSAPVPGATLPRRALGEPVRATLSFDAAATPEGWAPRLHALARFVRAGRIVLLRLRAAKRLAKLRVLVRAAGGDRAAVARLGDSLRHEREAGVAAPVRCGLRAERLQTDGLVRFEHPPAVAADRECVEVSLPAALPDGRTFPLKTPIYARTLGADFEAQPVSHWLPLAPAQSPLAGAEEEEPERAPRLAPPSLLQPRAMPEALLAAPSLGELFVFNPSPELHAHEPPLPVCEIDDAYLMRPEALGAAAPGNAAAAAELASAALSDASDAVRGVLAAGLAHVPRLPAALVGLAREPRLGGAREIDFTSDSDASGDEMDAAERAAVADAMRARPPAKADMARAFLLPRVQGLRLERDVRQEAADLEAQAQRSARVAAVRGRLVELAAMFDDQTLRDALLEHS